MAINDDTYNERRQRALDGLRAELQKKQQTAEAPAGQQTGAPTLDDQAKLAVFVSELGDKKPIETALKKRALRRQVAESVSVPALNPVTAAIDGAISGGAKGARKEFNYILPSGRAIPKEESALQEATAGISNEIASKINRATEEFSNPIDQSNPYKSLDRKTQIYVDVLKGIRDFDYLQRRGGPATKPLEQNEQYGESVKLLRDQFRKAVADFEDASAKKYWSPQETYNRAYEEARDQGPVETFGKSLVNASFFGLPDMIAGGVVANALPEQLIPKGYTRSPFGENSIKKLAQAEQTLQSALASEQSPVAAVAGGLAGAMNPRGAFAGIGGIADKLLKLNRGAQVAGALPQISRVGKMVGSGAASNVAYNQLGGLTGYTDPDIGADALVGGLMSLPGIPKKGGVTREMLKSGGLGVLGGGLASVVSGGDLKEALTQGGIAGAISSGMVAAGRASKKIKQDKIDRDYEVLKSELEQKIAQNQELNAARRLAYDQELLASREQAKTIPEKYKTLDVVSSADEFNRSVKKAELALNKKYSDIVDPLTKQFKDELVATDALKSTLDDVLAYEGVLKDNGKIDAKKIKNILSSDRRERVKKLAEYHEFLSGEQKGDKKAGNKGVEEDLSLEYENLATPGKRTLGEIDDYLKSLQEEAKFDKYDRGVNEKIFGKMFNDVRQKYLDLIEEVAGPKAKTKIAAARKMFAENQPLFKALQKIGRRTPEAIVRNANLWMQGSLIDDVLKNQPVLRNYLSDIVINNLSQKTTTAKMFSKYIDAFGRPSLKKLLGDEKFAELMKIEDRFNAASKKFLRTPGAKRSDIPPKPKELPSFLEDLKTSLDVLKNVNFLGRPLYNPRPGTLADKTFQGLAPVISKYLSDLRGATQEE